MKKSIIYLGIALVTFSNVASALNSQQSLLKEDLGLTQRVQSIQILDANTSGGGNDSIKKRNTKKGGDPISIDSESIGFSSYTKTTEEIIAENNQITENNISNDVVFTCNGKSIPLADNLIIDSIISADISPVCVEKTMEQIILEDSQIIENPILNVVKPINLRKSKKA